LDMLTDLYKSLDKNLKKWKPLLNNVKHYFCDINKQIEFNF
jgi:hypothetical protein